MCFFYNRRSRCLSRSYDVRRVEETSRTIAISKIIIAGCGYFGRHLGSRLTNQNTVYGVCRSQNSLNLISRSNIQPIQVDLSQKESVNHLPEADWMIVSAAPSRSEDRNEKTYSAIARTLSDWAEQRKIRIMVISSTSVYGKRNGEWVDEESVLDEESDSSRIQDLVSAERLYQEHVGKCLIVRASGIYGPERNRISRIKSGEYQPSLGSKYTNRIHIQDLVGIAIHLMESNLSGVFNASDDKPTTQDEFYEWLYQKIGMPLPSKEDSDVGHSKRCSNQKIKHSGYKLLYPSFKDGYGELLG